MKGVLITLLIITADVAVAQTAGERLDELIKAAYGTTPPLTMESTPPTAQQTMQWYGAIGAGEEIKKLEQEANTLVFSNTSRTTLSNKIAALEAQSRSADVTAAEGGVGGGNKGIAWYCNKITALRTALPARTQGFANNAVDYVRQLRAIPLGRDDSSTQLTSLTSRFIQGIHDWQANAATQALDKDINAVSSGLNAVVATSGSFGDSGNAATLAANNLKADAKKLYEMGDRLAPLIDLYVTARAAILAELPGLALDSAADIQKRDSMLNALRQSHTPKTTAAAWRTIIQDPATERARLADQALARIQVLTTSMSSEQPACSGMADPAAVFAALMQSAKQQIDSINQSVNATFTERTLAIENLDKEHADLIAKNEKEAEDIGKRIITAEARYDAMSEGDERQALYQKIVKAREIGAAAAQSAISLRLARQGVQTELQTTRGASTTVVGELSGAVSFLLSINSN